MKIITALITPFNDKKKIDYFKFGKLIEKQILQGASGIVVGGSTGERHLLSEYEENRLYQFVTCNYGDKIDVYLGVGEPASNIAVKKLKKYNSLNFKGYLINVPFYIYRRRDNSITTNMFNDEKWYHSYIKVIDNLERFAKKIRGKKSYRYLKNRIGQIALSILKNPIAYGADKIYINKIIAEVKTKKIYKIPMKSKNCFIKIQGILMMFPKVFVKLYSKRGRNEKNKRNNKKD